MPNLDNTSNQATEILFFDLLGAASQSSILDIANYSPGVCIFVGCYSIQAGQTIDFEIYESDDPGMSGQVLVPDSSLIGEISDLGLVQADSSLNIKQVGLLNSKRYIRVEWIYPIGATSENLFVGARVMLEIAPKNG